jgi:hypothetical protein
MSHGVLLLHCVVVVVVGRHVQTAYIVGTELTEIPPLMFLFNENAAGERWAAVG